MSKKPKNNNSRYNNAKNNQEQYVKPAHFELRYIKPLTQNQQITFDTYRQGFNLMLHGFAGTGKTFCALYLALNELLVRRKYIENARLPIKRNLNYHKLNGQSHTIFPAYIQ